MSSSSLIYSTVLSSILLISSSVFLISIIVLFSSVWFFFIFSKSLLNFLLCSPTLLLSFLNIFMVAALISLLDRSPLPPRLILLVFYLVLSFGTHSLFTSFCLIFSSYFYILGRLVMFPDFGEVACVRNILEAPVAHCPLLTRAICSMTALDVGCVGPVLQWGQLL